MHEKIVICDDYVFSLQESDFDIAIEDFETFDEAINYPQYCNC